ncbi:hypothetical protein ACFC0C_31795 [Streptomyces sp. NPDC056178]|uniref:hypothetical protein n=1 Tax=Streptomyces sp. NPDC056178 TaxID=3345735 RepID=UPI0035E0623D
MTHPLSQQTIQQLAFVLLLHEQGIAQSVQPEPMSAAAVLSFQDALRQATGKSPENDQQSSRCGL